MTLDAELAGVLRRTHTAQDIVPFLGRWFPAADTAFRLLPDDMLAILTASADFEPLEPGGAPTVLQLERDDEHAKITVYRAAADARYYVLAPAAPARG